LELRVAYSWLSDCTLTESGLEMGRRWAKKKESQMDRWKIKVETGMEKQL